MSLKMFNGNNLPHELLLTTRQRTKSRNALNNNMSTEKFFKLILSGGFLESLLSKLAGPLMKLAVPLAKPILGISAIYAGIQKKIYGSGVTTLITSKDEMNDAMKIVQALDDSNILLKRVTETIKNETKEQKGVFLSMLLGTPGASLLGNLLTGKGAIVKRHGQGFVRANCNKL